MNKPRILIVQDRSDAGRFLESGLRTGRFQWIGTANSIQETLLLADSANPDLAILNFARPREPEAIQTAGILRARFDIPVLYLVDEADAGFFEQAQADFPGSCLTKPFSERELARALEGVLDRHHLLCRLKVSETQLAETQAVAESYRQQLNSDELRAVEQTSKRFRIALDSSPDAIFLIDPASLCFLDFNQTACDSLGYTRAELLNLGPNDIKPEFDKAALHERFVEVFAGKPGADLIQTQHRRKDGSNLPVEIRLRPFQSENDMLMVAVARDISARILTEVQLKEANERFLQLAENVSEVFWIRDLDENRFLYINPAFETMFRIPVDHAYLHPRTFLDKVHPEDRARVASAFDWQHQHRQGVDLEYRIIVGENELRWIWVRTFPVRDHVGKVYRMVGIAENMTHRRESEEQYRTIIQASIDGFWVADAQGRILDCNEAYCNALGYTREEVLDLPISELDHNESPEQTAEHIRQIIEQGKDRFETRHLHKNGHLIDIEVSTYYQRDAKGGRFYAFLRDITTRKQAERALRESELRYRGLIANLPGIAYRCAMDADWTMEVFSGEVESLTGYPASDFLDKHRAYASIIHPDDTAMVIQAVRKSVSKKISYEIEYRICHAHGHIVIVHENGHGIYDENGELLWLDGFIWDVTERALAKQALLESEERYRAVVEDQTEIISRFRVDGQLTFVNDVYCRFFGHTADELIGQTWRPVVFPEDKPIIEAKLRTLSPSSPVLVIENRVYSANGDEHWMQFVNRAFFDADGQITEIQSVGRDITDRKKAEQALLKANDFKRAILDAVSTQVAVLDEMGTIIEVNESWRRFAIENIGANSQTISATDVGINYLALCHAARGVGAEGAQEAASGIRAVLDGRLDVFTQEYPCHSPDRQRWFMMTATPLSNARSGVVVSHSDITAPRLLAERLRENEMLLKRTQIMARIGSWELDIASSRLRWSDETYRIFGSHAHTPLTTASFFACVHPDDREIVNRAWGAALDGAPYDIEHRILVDGETRWIHEQADIRFDSHGQPVCGYGFVQDINPRKQAELALQQSDARSRSILRAAPIGIGVIVDRVFLEVNEAMTIITGFKAEELQGRSTRMLYPTQTDYDYVGTEKYRQIEAHGIGTVETRWQRKNGELIDVALTSSPIVADDLSQGVTFTALDITSDKQAEQARLTHEASQRNALVRDVHHRIKNNLQGVIGLLRQHIARHPDIQAPIEAAITQINTIAVVHGLQSRMPQNELRIRALLREVNGAAAAMAMVSTPPEIEDTLAGDVWLDNGAAVTIALVINELIQNALKHRGRADDTGIKVSLGGNSQRVTLHIRNPGEPLPPGFDLHTGKGCGTGLDLVRILLPRRGAELSLHYSEGSIDAGLVLTAPVIVDSGTLVDRHNQVYE